MREKTLWSFRSWNLNYYFQNMVFGNELPLEILSFTVSLEDAHRHNDLSLIDKFKNTTIILGVVTIANSKVETVDEIKERVT